MTDVQILAIDLAKRSFQVCATAAGGVCGCPQFCKVIFRRFGRRGASIARVSGLLLWPDFATGRYAVRRTRSTSVQRALLLERRDWFARPGTLKSLPHNRQSISLSGLWAPKRIPLCLSEGRRVTPFGNSVRASSWPRSCAPSCWQAQQPPPCAAFVLARGRASCRATRRAG